MGREEHLRRRLLEQVVDDFARHLDRQALFEELLEDLEPWLESREFAAGETLVGFRFAAPRPVASLRGASIKV